MNSVITLLRFTLLTIFLTCGSVMLTHLQAQEISLQEADRLARESSRSAGFSKIFFPASTLQSLLNNSAGIRFYNGLPNRSRTAVLMAIGVNSDGEVGDEFIQSDENSILAKISREQKEQQVQNLASSRRLVAFTAAFNSADLLKALEGTTVSGLHFQPASRENADGTTTLTLTLAGASSPTSTLSTSAMFSPCPPDCPDK